MTSPSSLCCSKSHGSAPQAADSRHGRCPKLRTCPCYQLPEHSTTARGVNLSLNWLTVACSACGGNTPLPLRSHNLHKAVPGKFVKRSAVGPRGGQRRFRMHYRQECADPCLSGALGTHSGANTNVWFQNTLIPQTKSPSPYPRPAPGDHKSASCLYRPTCSARLL